MRTLARSSVSTSSTLIPAGAWRLGSALVMSVLAALTGCGGGSADPICLPSNSAQAAMDFCAPTSIAAGQTLRLQIREQCGGCTQRATRCEVALQGQELKLRLVGESCTLAPGTACPAICAISTFDCSVPPLAAGTYRVTTEAGSTLSIMMTASTTVSATSCTIP